MSCEQLYITTLLIINTSIEASFSRWTAQSNFTLHGDAAVPSWHLLNAIGEFRPPCKGTLFPHNSSTFCPSLPHPHPPALNGYPWSAVYPAVSDLWQWPGYTKWFVAFCDTWKGPYAPRMCIGVARPGLDWTISYMQGTEKSTSYHVLFLHSTSGKP